MYGGMTSAGHRNFAVLFMFGYFRQQTKEVHCRMVFNNLTTLFEQQEIESGDNEDKRSQLKNNIHYTILSC
ncbi:hypothetical protein PanWU01x14_356420 [Parasponia andersonii]|uniref:Uncharacterized protein n=1 Tax=Parasponia andersonii TaxID=3476 RepID=A0A2P5A8Z2_PARAD|nr:hypothetical protein PanWU01x14_356420 [Parasponia andersonii]